MTGVNGKMTTMVTFALLLMCLFVRPSYQDCKVMAECDDNVTWRHWPSDSANGRPGKRGAPGPRGEQGFKGEPGEAAVIEPPEEESGPTREFLSHTITWDSAKEYCLGIGRRLCRGSEICIHENGGRRMIHEVLLGDHWTPILDSHNKWLQVGDSRRFTCYSHTETHSGAKAAWGNDFTPMRHKSYVYCCGERNAEKRYRYIGKTATYDKARSHCVSLGKRLCHASEVCNNNVPVFGKIARDTWVPVNDRHNEWIQIGNERTCFVHGVHYGAPTWGVRTDGSQRDYAGFVLCC